MSNARYFANGTDFYRVVYGEGLMDGPYTKFSSAVRQGKSVTRVHSRRTTEFVEGKIVWGDTIEWQNYTEYKVQKLMPVDRDSTLSLEWQDVTE